jgi:hypothetical protein
VYSSRRLFSDRLQASESISETQASLQIGSLKRSPGKQIRSGASRQRKRSLPGQIRSTVYRKKKNNSKSRPTAGCPRRSRIEALGNIARAPGGVRGARPPRSYPLGQQAPDPLVFLGIKDACPSIDPSIQKKKLEDRPASRDRAGLPPSASLPRALASPARASGLAGRPSCARSPAEPLGHLPARARGITRSEVSLDPRPSLWSGALGSSSFCQFSLLVLTAISQVKLFCLEKSVKAGIK